MSNVDLSIGGRDFRVSCAAGEEAHIAALGRMIDEKVTGLGMAGQSEGRMLLFAALLLADELHEGHRNGTMPEAAQAPTKGDGVQGVLAERLEAMATKLENCATSLEA